MKRFKNILYVMETTEDSKLALDRAVTLAENNQANLTVIDVVPRITAGIGLPKDGPISEELQTVLKQTHLQELDNLISPYNKRIEIKTKILIGTPFLEIIHEVLRNQHDLVIKIPENQDWLERIFGSDDMHLLRKCPCPVWLIKPTAVKTYRRILAAVDVEDIEIADEMNSRKALNQEILELASSLTFLDSSELHIVHVWNAIAEDTLRGPFVHVSNEQVNSYLSSVLQEREKNLDKAIKVITKKSEQQFAEHLKPQKHLIKGWPREEIPKLAKHIDADLVVMGTVVRTGISGFLMGNTAEAVLNQLDCSVLAIKPPGFKTPVSLKD